ncbi:MAG: hypothetical protein EOO08_15560 [Chitinophagaceae bacterium]|nr:MAG: hypothetical protein EOO08_15560 [Chitinophagaceae bacterium]
MKALLLALSFLGIFAASAQKKRVPDTEASWKLLLNKKILLKATTEDEAANVIPVKRRKKCGPLQVAYVPASSQKTGWNRTITVYGANDQELFKASGNSLKMSWAKLSALAKGQTELKVYTMAIPSDPAKAALVRVRRVHLVTIRLV